MGQRFIGADFKICTLANFQSGSQAVGIVLRKKCLALNVQSLV